MKLAGNKILTIKLQKYSPLILISAGVLAIAAFIKRNAIKNFFSEIFSKAKKAEDKVKQDPPIQKPAPKEPEPPIEEPVIQRENPPIEPVKPSPKVEIEIPKFESTHPLGSKEYFDERMEYVDKTSFDFASKRDEEGFIKFLNVFDELNKIAKSPNKGAFNEFRKLNASFAQFKEGHRSDRLLSRYLDTYHNHVEDFDFGIINKGYSPVFIYKIYTENMLK
ncbi:MAG: hypothetical protein MZV64_27230 [Ignavibacteriales bacterium]|nr:hypothetical protein [Ignavibacteriales bacterium]